MAITRLISLKQRQELQAKDAAKVDLNQVFGPFAGKSKAEIRSMVAGMSAVQKNVVLADLAHVVKKLARHVLETG